MTILSFDQIHSLGLKRRSMPIKQYFDEMLLTDEQKDERIAIAQDLAEVIRTAFDIILLQSDYGNIDWDIVGVEVASMYRDALEKHIPIDDILDDYIDDFADNFVEVTKRHIDEELIEFATVAWIAAEEGEEVERTDEHPVSDAYYISEDRAILIGEEEANSDANYDDFRNAKADGATSKTWHTMLDNRVRETHRPLESKTIPIDNFFLVGDAMMLYPRDVEHAEDNPEEICGCRCSVTYS